MYVKEIEYEDYSGEKIKENFYFNLTETELLKAELATPGGLTDKMLRIVNSRDVPKMAEFFDWIIRKSYGEISEDKKRFIKSDEISKAFTETEAYNKLFTEFFNDTTGKALSDFINGIVPKDLAAKMSTPEAQAELEKRGISIANINAGNNNT